MKKRLRDVMDYLEFDELMRIKQDLQSGGIHLGQLVDHKIREEMKKHEVQCSICNERIDPFSVNNFTLIFGPDDLKKKATFCAMDCLEYFLNNLKELRTEANPNQKPSETKPKEV